MLREIIRKIPTAGPMTICPKCFCRYERHQVKLSLFEKYEYFTCRICNDISGHLDNIEKVIALLDFSLKKKIISNKGHTLYINWSKYLNGYFGVKKPGFRSKSAGLSE